MGFLQHKGMTKLYEPPIPKGVGEFRDTLKGFDASQVAQCVKQFQKARCYQVDKHTSLAKENYEYLFRLPALKNNPVILHNLRMMK